MNVYSQSMELEYQGITSCSVASFSALNWGFSCTTKWLYIYIYITNIITIVGVISQPMGLKIPFLYPRHSQTFHPNCPLRYPVPSRARLNDDAIASFGAAGTAAGTDTPRVPLAPPESGAMNCSYEPRCYDINSGGFPKSSIYLIYFRIK